MKKQTSKKRGTVVLSGFGAALSLMAGNLAQAQTVAQPTLSSTKVQTQVGRVRTTVTFDKATLCKLHSKSCLTSKPYVKRLSAAQKRKLNVLIGLGVQTDIKDACLVC